VLLLVRLGLLGVCCLAPLAETRPAPPGPAVENTAPRAPEEKRPSKALEALRRRLRGLPEADRIRLERHLEEFEKLSPQAREKVLRRALALRERERSLPPASVEEPAAPTAGVPDVAPDRVEEGVESPVEGAAEGSAGSEGLEGHTRREHRRHLREEIRRRGAELRAGLPEELRARLERMPPEHRRKALERLWQNRERASRRALETMRRRFDLPAPEVERLLGLPLEERLRAMRELDRSRRGRRHP